MILFDTMSRSFIVILGEINSIDYYAVLVQFHCFLLLIKSYIGNNCKGCLHDTGATFALALFSPRFLYSSENFTPVSCKREVTTPFDVKSASRWTGTGRACVVFVNSGWRRQVGHGTTKKHTT